MTAEPIEAYLDLCQQAKSLATNSCLAPLRQRGFNAFKKQGFAGIKEEDWIYTRVAPIIKPRYQLACANQATLSAKDIATHTISQGDVLVFINGYFSTDLSRLNSAANICSLSQASIEQHPLLIKHLGQAAKVEQVGFNSLNTALMQDGAFIHIAANTIVEHPIQILAISLDQDTEHLNTLRHLIVAEPHSQAQIVESYIHCNAAQIYFNNVISEVFLQNNAQLKHYKFQCEEKQSFHVHSIFAQQQHDSHYQTYNFDFGSKLTRNGLQSQLLGQGAAGHLYGLYLAKDQQHIDNHTRIEHQVAHTSSREFYKGIATDAAKAVFNGQIFIKQDAQKTDAQQQNPNLVLSTHAEIDTKPQLEIFADDVKCSHGATIGQLDEQALFYLRTRGLNQQTAQDVLTYGFAHELISHIEHQTLRYYLHQALLNWLPQGEIIQSTYAGLANVH